MLHGHFLFVSTPNVVRDSAHNDAHSFFVRPKDPSSPHICSNYRLRFNVTSEILLPVPIPEGLIVISLRQLQYKLSVDGMSAPFNNAVRFNGCWPIICATGLLIDLNKVRVVQRRLVLNTSHRRTFTREAIHTVIIGRVVYQGEGRLLSVETATYS